MWLEGEAGRGAQEVGSCIRKHLEMNLSGNVKELIVWSDSCGGQNRNIKMVLLFKSILATHPQIEKITMRYLVPGYTYLPNDAEFGDIECALKLHNRLYTPDDYISVMKNARKRNKLVVNRMHKEDFVSVSKLEKGIVNRKKDLDGEVVSWLMTREIILTKDKPFTIELSKCFGGKPQVLDIGRGVSRRMRQSRSPFGSLNPAESPDGNHLTTFFTQELDLLWPNGKPISGPKLADIKSMLHLIPADAKGFYSNLTEDNTIIDDIDGFDGNVDFPVQMD